MKKLFATILAGLLVVPVLAQAPPDQKGFEIAKKGGSGRPGI